MKDEGLDFIPMILLLGLSIFVALNCIFPIWRESREAYAETYDKSLGKIQGVQYMPNNSTDSHLSYEDLIVTLATQSGFLPYPPVLDVCGDKYIVQHTDETDSLVGAIEYTPDNRDTVESIKQSIHNWSNACSNYYTLSGSQINGFKLHFKVKYTPGTLEETSDDCYSVFCIGINSEGVEEYFRCLPGGKIDGLNQDFGATLDVDILQY